MRNLITILSLFFIFTDPAFAETKQAAPTLKDYNLPGEVILVSGDRNLTMPEPKARLGSIARQASAAIQDSIPKLPNFFMDDLSAAYSNALNQDKFLIVYFRDASCHWCTRLDEDITVSKELAMLKDCAIFVVAEEAKSNSAKALGSALNLKNYPAISILYPSSAVIHEAARLTGYIENEKLVQFMRDSLIEASLDRDAPDDFQDNPIAACPVLAKLKANI